MQEKCGFAVWMWPAGTPALHLPRIAWIGSLICARKVSMSVSVLCLAFTGSPAFSALHGQPHTISLLA